MKNVIYKGVSGLSGVALITLGIIYMINIRNPSISDYLIIVLLVFVPLTLGVVLTHNENPLELAQIREERKTITDKIESKKEVDIFETIQLSLNQLNEYYTINKAQAKNSFAFSMIAIVMGLISILTGIGFFYTGKTNITTTVISSISGILLEFIGGAYFFLYKKSLEQVNLFFGQLIKVQDTMVAINMAKGVNDEKRRIDIEEKIIISLLERSLK